MIASLILSFWRTHLRGCLFEREALHLLVLELHDDVLGHNSSPSRRHFVYRRKPP
jgi:hypothetical protein